MRSQSMLHGQIGNASPVPQIPYRWLGKGQDESHREAPNNLPPCGGEWLA